MTALSAMDFTVPLALLLLAGTVWLVAWQVRAYHRVEQPARSDHRLPAVERELLGDDWRTPVIPFLEARFEARTRTRLVIAAQCGADPYKSESRDWTRPSVPA